LALVELLVRAEVVTKSGDSSSKLPIDIAHTGFAHRKNEIGSWLDG
jgi:hypothetical protein